MTRLRFVIAFTSDVEQMKRFYRDLVGLRIASESPFFVEFESDGAALSLLAVRPGQKREIELCFETPDVERDTAALRGRGVDFLDEIRQQEFGKVVHFRDPEGSLLSLLEPTAASAVASARRETVAVGLASGPARGLAGREAATSLATEEGFGPGGFGRPGDRHDAGRAGAKAAVSLAAGPSLSTAIVNCRDLATARAFYRDRVGLHVKMDSPWWVELDAGSTKFALHPWVDRPEAEMHHGQPVTLGFAIDDLRSWADGARERGVVFLNAPIDEGFGLTAEATDPEGNVIVFREPAEGPAVEDELAEAFEHEDPHQVPIRKTVKKGVKAVSRVVLKPVYKNGESGRKTAKKRASPKKAVHSTRGAGPAGTRLKPKRAADPKRARNRPAVGRLKKAERRTLSRKKSAVAGASKAKPLKRKVARRVARTGKRR